ncbi:hypothetical protein NVV94_20290 [Pseudomonas sp. LS1212]|uniref:DUF6990 domain-containing protein n=1 Tax=Pseudomonas sp. LS1212 TaxID=2972478 RepID=UPI00215CE990|nr:hypothetical protein [Pseudomonas sp. LS1212]UVJ42907.1 hypothetical protein NVV94_20290 [Pseudomonas sp. LS1212]
MKEKEILPTLEELGWRCRKDEVGDYFCLMDLGKVQVQIIPAIGKRSDHFRVSLMPSLSTKTFTETVEFILGEAGGFDPIIVSNDVPEKIVDFSLDDVTRLSQAAISWASAQDIEKGLAAYRALPTNSKGAMPLRHLAALAMAGDVGRLASYQRSFEQGDRLGFVPYITLEMIDRALLIARDVQ